MSDLSKLISIVKQLRAPNGCDWDKEQTKESLIPYFIEEMYERGNEIIKDKIAE